MTTLFENMESAQVWSLMAKTPVLVYSVPYDSYIVYWNGIIMTKTYALLIIAQRWMDIYYTSSVKESAWDEYNRVYRLGAFGHHNWDKIISRQNENSMVSYLINVLCKDDRLFLSNLVEKYSAKEALSWFDPVDERTVDGEVN